MESKSRNEIDRLLADSLKQLSETRPIDKITIKEITDRAGVIRPTFYNHFQDKYELLEWIVRTELIEPMVPLINSGMLREGVLIAMKAIRADSSFYRQAVRLEGQNSFKEVLCDSIRDLILRYLSTYLKRQKTPYEWITPERIASFYAGSMTYIVTDWIMDGMKIPENELVDTFIYLFTHSVLEVVGGKK